MTTIRTFTSQIDASFCASFLQANGVDAVLLDEASFVNNPGTAIGIRLQVPEEQLNAANACLARLSSKAPDSQSQR